MSAEHYFQVNWDEFHRDSKALAAHLKPMGPWRGIVAITRGGLAPAAVLAQELELRFIDTLCMTSYTDDEKQAELQLIKAFHDHQQGQGLIVVDDLVDTGATFDLTRTLLPKAHLAALYAKPAGEAKVDSYVSAIAQHTWVVFPWEV